MPYPASQIAYAFVVKGIEENNPVTQMKLQKMVYFAHGYHLAKFDDPLIVEDFEAWKYGPVVRSIYHSYKLFGSERIEKTNWILDIDRKKDLSSLDVHARETIEYTWKVTSGMSAYILSNWTHEINSPWSNTFKNSLFGIAIDNDEIKNYFKELIFKSA